MYYWCLVVEGIGRRAEGGGEIIHHTSSWSGGRLVLTFWLAFLDSIIETVLGFRLITYIGERALSDDVSF